MAKMALKARQGNKAQLVPRATKEFRVFKVKPVLKVQLGNRARLA